MSRQTTLLRKVALSSGIDLHQGAAAQEGVVIIGRLSCRLLSFKRRIEEPNHDPREPLIGGLV
jgi:hypothetical protein